MSLDLLQEVEKARGRAFKYVLRMRPDTLVWDAPSGGFDAIVQWMTSMQVHALVINDMFAAMHRHVAGFYLGKLSMDCPLAAATADVKRLLRHVFDAGCQGTCGDYVTMPQWSLAFNGASFSMWGPETGNPSAWGPFAPHLSRVRVQLLRFADRQSKAPCVTQPGQASFMPWIPECDSC